MNPDTLLQPQDALLLVDVQNDFCPGGGLAVPHGDGIIPMLNDWIASASKNGNLIVASRDWHPVEHVSFDMRGGPWPVHCVQDTQGAEFHPDLNIDDRVVRVSKGTHFDQDAYSAFDSTGLGTFLRRANIQRLWVGGLAQDVCVLATVLDGLKEGFEVHLIRAATRPVDETQGEDALNQMKDAGAILY